MANIQSIITYNANLSPAQAQIKALTGQIAGLTAAFNTLDKSALKAQRSLASAFTANVGQIGGFTTQTVQAHNAVQNFGKQLEANRLTMRQYFREAFAGYAKQNSLMKQLAVQQVRYQQSVAVPLGGGQMALMTPTSLAATGNAAALAAAKFAVFNKLIDSGATAMLNWGKNTQWAGRQLMVGFTVPLAMFTAVASKQFRDLDKELTRFQKVYGSDLGGSMSKATQQMRNEVQALAYDISRTYGIAAKDTAALAADIAATGAEGEKLISSVQQTTRLAVLGEVDRQEAMKATLALQSAFKMNTNELADSINFLNAVENQTSTTLEDLAGAIPRVGPVIRSLGGDVKDLATLLVAMREGGVPAAEAANALKSGLASLINPTKQASEVAKQFGVDLVGIVEANKGQLMPTIYAMQDALSGLDSFSKSRVIEQIFGKYQFARITALFDNLGKVGSQTQSVLELASKSSADLAGIANQELRTLTESTSVKFTRALEQLKNAIIPLGQALTETFIPIFETIGKGMKAFSSFFQSLPEPVKNFAKYGVAIAALAGPVIMLVGLFGNLIANGIKFGLMMTRLGARIAGIKVQPFELLNAEVMAAKLGIDNLTSSFTTQEAAMKKLVATMSQYEASLRRMTAANPALFIPGAVPPAGGRMPIRRQTGSSSPERVPGGYGGGDKIPALLEPGEMVVRKEAASQYAPIILAMNRGNIQKLSNGTTAAAHTSMPFAPNTKQFSLAFTVMAALSRGGKDFIEFAKKFPESVKVVSRSVAILPATLNQALKTGVASKQFISGWNQTGGGKYAASAIQGGFDMAQKGASQALTDFSNKVRDEAVRIAKATNNGKVNDDILAKAQRKVIAEIQQTASSQDPIQIASKNLAKAIENQSLRLGAVRISPTADMLAQARAGKGGFSLVDGKVSYKNFEIGRVSQEGKLRDKRYSMPGYISGGISSGADSRLSAAADKLLNAGVKLSSPFGKFTRESGALVGVPERGKGGTGYLTTGKALGLVEKELSITTDKLMEKLLNSFILAVKKSIESGSPSRRAERELGQEGKNLGDGALIGLRNGFKSAVAGKQIIAGPVGGGGLESISNAQKVAQADQTIIKLKETQLKYTADRVRAEVELLALQKAYARGEINIVQYKEQERKIAADLKLAKEKELRIQNIIDQQKQKIADADAAQLRAEQEETRNAQRRAAASVGIGPGGSAGWLMGGVSPYAKDKTPDWLRTRMNEAQKAARKGVPTGPSASLATVRATSESNGMRGMGAMNAMFAISMLTSSLTMVSGASEDAAAKIGMFTTALMTATMLMNTGISGKGVATNFLGLGSLGKKAMVTGRGMNIAAAAGGGVSRGGMALMGLGRGLSILGGPVGIAAGIGITAAITGFMMYRDAADKARERAIAAFNDPVKSAEYFGETIKNVSDIIENNRLSNISKDLEGIDSALREAVKQDYGPLIEQISSLSAGSGAQQLSMAYSNMIISGMSAENAKATIEAIATEAGMAGGAAFTEALSLGLLDQELTIKQAIDNIVGQFKPGETQLGNTGLTIAQSITKEITDTEDAIAKLAPSMNSFQQWTLGLLPESWSSPELKNLIDQLDALRDRLQDLMSVNPELLSGVFDSLTIAYQQDPEAAISGLKDLTDIISGLAEGDQDAAMRQATDYLKNVYGESWNSINKSIDTQEELVVALQMAISGVSLDKATNSAGEFDAALGKATVSAKTLADATKLLRITAEEEYFTMINDFAQQQRDKINLDFENYSNAMDERIGLYEGLKEAAQESFDAEQKARQDSIDGMQDEMDQRRRAFDEEMDRLDDKENAIKKSSDAYIKSLEKNQKAESFYSQQRKTAFGALQKLASGDVFGFLQEREQMSQDAQQFSYDEMINKIEEKRDLELEVIDEVRKKKQDEQKEYEQMMEDRIQSVQDLMEIEQEAHDDRMKFYDDQIKRANTARQNALDDKNQEINGIKDMETDYRENSTKAEETYSKKYAELKAKPYVEARKEMLRLRIEEIYYRGGVSLARAVEQAGALAFPFRGRSAVTGVQNVLNELGLRGDPSWMYRSDNVGDTGIGDTQAVRDMTVTAQNVTINGGSTNNPDDTDGDGTPNISDPFPDDPTRKAMGGYIQRFQDGGGGKVSGPGGPKSDVIPALVSNGEYIVQASSVKQYGKDMMDAINAGKYATGGIVGYKDGTNNPTWYSADRAEQAATGTRGSPKPQYSGGTPTYSGGYTNAGKQAYSNYNNKKNKFGGGDFKPGIDFPINSTYNPDDPTGLKGVVDSIRVGLATILDSFVTPFRNPLGINMNPSTTTSVGEFIGGSAYTQSDILSRSLSAMSMIPVGGIGKTSTIKSRNISKQIFEKDKADLESLIGANPAGLPSRQTQELLYTTRTDQLIAKNPSLKPGSPEFLKEFIKEYYPFANQDDVITLYKGVETGKKLENLKNWTGDPSSTGAFFSANPVVAEGFASLFGGTGKLASMDVPIKDFFNGSSYVKGFPFHQGDPTKTWTDEMESIIDYLNVPDYVKSTLNIKDVPGYRGVKTTNAVYDLLNEFFGMQKFADGGLVGAMEKWFPNNKHNFYSGWDKYNSWAGGKPGLVMMHHTALQPGVSQDQELNSFAKDWKGQPVVQGFIQKSGQAYTLAGGNTGYGAGEGTTQYMQGQTSLAKELIDVAGHPNSVAWQIETSSAGETKDFTSGQFDSIARMTAAIREWAGWPSFKGRIINHKDWAGYRTDGTARNDTLYPISLFEDNANKIWESGGGTTNTPTPNNQNNNDQNVPSSVESLPPKGLYGILSFVNGKTKSPKPGPPADNTTSNFANDALSYAMKQVGKPYSYDAQPPDSWDCSKLTAWSWNVATGKNILTPYSHVQANELTQRVKGLNNGRITGLSPGDVLYFKTEYDPSFGHTSMYAGNNKIVQASSPSTGVLVSDLNSSWNIGINPKTNKPRFQWAGPPKGYANGGFISGPGGPTSDSIPILASNGEYVMKANAVSKYGKGFMDQVNAGAFAMGGMVGSPRYSVPELPSNNVSIQEAISNNSSINNSSKVNIVINGASGQSATAIANKVVSMINSSNNRRDHSRSI